VKLLSLLIVVGLLGFFLVSNVFPFRNQLFSGVFPKKVTYASTNWPDDRFATAGHASSTLGDPYFYDWDTMSDPNPPDQIALYPNQTFARVVGKFDNRHDGLSCRGCSQSNVDAIYNAEVPKIKDLLSRDVNKQGVWIVGNEANAGPQIGSSLYAYQYKKYHALIKSLDPNAKLANSGLLYMGTAPKTIVTPPNYLNNVLANINPVDWPDIYNVHFYPGGTQQSYYDKNVSQAKEFKNYLISKGEGSKPIWVTEFGINTKATQAQTNSYMDQMVNAFVTQNLAQRWFWFVGSYYTATYDITSLTKNGQPTLTGLHYKDLATKYAPVMSPSPSPTASVSASVAP
jgi:hypothetical protein